MRRSRSRRSTRKPARSRRSASRRRRPDTGFGYIRLGGALDDGAHQIDRFVEKPAAELAAQYVAAGTYWWNSGIFVVRASVWLAALERLQPEMHARASRRIERADAPTARTCARTPPRSAASPSDSIDYAVMEHLGTPSAPCAGVVVPLDAGWSDLGSWDAVWDAMEKDESGNVASGRVVFEGATSSYARSEGGRLVACVGTTNIIVVETDDAVLVADRSRVQDIKGLVVPHPRAARARSGHASQGAPPVGFLRFDRSRRPLPGEAHRGEAGRAPVAADASPPRRALDRRVRHGARHARRRTVPAQRERVDLHSARRAASAGEPGQGAARDHRGAVGHRISAKTTSFASTTTTAAAVNQPSNADKSAVRGEARCAIYRDYWRECSTSR